MSQAEIFSLALGVTKPWYIEKVEFSKGEGLYGSGELHLYVNFKVGWKFLDPEGQQICEVHDTVERTWRHVNFFQHDCYIHGRIPRIILGDNRVVQVEVPWARSGSSFTLLFDAMSMMFVQEGMSLSGAGRMMHEDGRVIGRIISWYVDKAKQEQPLEAVKVLGIDEVSYKKGHSYLTILSDTEQKKVVGIGVGKGINAIGEGLSEMEQRGAEAKEVEHVTTDLSPAFIAAVLTFLPDAKIVYDRFHVEQLLSRAVDTVRKLEQHEAIELKKTKYLWLRNKKDLTKKQSQKIHYLTKCFPTLGKAYRLKEQFKQIYNQAYIKPSLNDLKAWMKIAIRSKIQPIIAFVNTLKSHWSGIKAFFNNQYTNAFAEQINSTIQNIKRIARGYRNVNNYKTMIYFRLGKLNVLPT